MADDRFLKQSGTEARLAEIIAPVAEDLGYQLVRVKILHDRGTTLQIMAEDKEGRFSIDDCETLSRELSPALDLADPIPGEYHLEVSSPGIDRYLVRARDFQNAAGHEARIELLDVNNGRRRFRGIIREADDDGVTIELPDNGPGQEGVHRIAYRQIGEAKLILTDALLEMARRDQETNDPIGSDDVELVSADEGETD